MGVDLSQFHQVFFEESFEGLDLMESGLLNIDLSAPDSEQLNAIFRAAHSIKGGGGTFGFMQVSNFTHVLETLLDEVRAGQRVLLATNVDLLLKSVDCLRRMLEALQAETEPDTAMANELKAEFEKILSAENPSASETCEPTSEVSQTQVDSDVRSGAEAGWTIQFTPARDMLRTGNEPLRMFRELKVLEGAIGLEVTADTTKVPEFAVLDPEDCFLSWTLELKGDVKESDIRDIFAWVEDEADIRLTPFSKLDRVVDKASLHPDVGTETDTKVVGAASSLEQSTLKPVKAECEANKPTALTSAPKAAASESTVSNAKQPPKAAKSPAKAAEASSIRVSTDKVDSLINMVGELVITQSMLGQLGRDFDMGRLQDLLEGLAQLEHNTRELQESVMKIRMMPISFVFSRFPRLVRDLGQQLGKEIDLVLMGETTELDKTVMERIGDPMVHLVRNSLDHGIEQPGKREAAGKPRRGTIILMAYHQSGNIVIEIKDDGAGLNTDRIRSKAIERGLISQSDSLSDGDIHELIFEPGFSTAETVSDVSGRGVGMDVVKRNITELNGSVEVESQLGVGSIFKIRLPLTLAILDGQLVSVGNQIYIFPLTSIVESIQVDTGHINSVGGLSEVLQLRDEYVPIIRLYEVFNINPKSKRLDESLIVVVEHDAEKVGIVVDDLLGQQQVVIKSLEENYRKVEGVSGATILGDGKVALIVDVTGLSKMVGLKSRALDALVA
jgi:two-component system chemotaxis sensor kinase CheA